MRTAFYGGTFDPVHNTHLATAREILKHGAADQILFVPAAVLPHVYKSGTGITPFADRMAMVRLAVAGEPGFLCSDIESRRPGKSYTLDTLRELRAENRYGELLLFMGTDTLAKLATWNRVHDLVKEFGLIIYPRPDTPADSIDLSKDWNAEEIRKIRASILPDMPQFPLSSTQIREKIKKDGIKSVSEFVKKDVADYITAHHLYV